MPDLPDDATSREDRMVRLVANMLLAAVAYPKSELQAELIAALQHLPGNLATATQGCRSWEDGDVALAQGFLHEANAIATLLPITDHRLRGLRHIRNRMESVAVQREHLRCFFAKLAQDEEESRLFAASMASAVKAPDPRQA